MKYWHAAAIGWGYCMAAYAGSCVFGRDFVIAMACAGCAALLGVCIIVLRRDFDR